MKLTLNLATGPYVNRRALYVLYGVLAAVLVLALLLNVAYALHLRSTAGQIREHLSELEHKAVGQETPANVTPEALKQQQEKIEFANQILERDSFRWTELLDHLEETAVEGMSIRALLPDYKEKSLQVKGVARGVENLRRYLDELIASDHFSEVYLLEQAQTKVTDALGQEHSAVAFSIVLKGAF